MISSNVVVLLVAETPLSPSTGVGLGEVDRPVQRDPATGLPVIRGSTVKGALRHHLRSLGREFLISLSGEGNAPLRISVGDARLIALPVPSNSEFMVWLTSPYLLGRFETDSGQRRRDSGTSPDDGGVCYSAGENGVMLVDFLDRIVKVKRCDNHTAALRELTCMIPEFLQMKLLVLGDRVIKEVYDLGLGRRARVKLGEKKSVEKGKLWIEEYFPQYSLFYFNMFVMKGAEEILNLMRGRGLLFPIGGSFTLGFGLVRARIVGGCDRA